jgi:GDP-4-dehydro-6-deoxy-D-mannose reductase
VAGFPLVTGATGFAGGHLVDHLLETSPDVAAWGNPRGRPLPQADDRRVRWRAVDLLNGSAVRAALAELRPAAIYHCAGVPHVAESWTDRTHALRVNVLGTHHVLDGVRRAGLTCPVLVTGSALVYRASPGPLTEDDPIGPSDPYGVSKLAQEMLAARARDVAVYIARPFNHAGPRQASAFATASFARQIAEIESGAREPVIRVGNLSARRDLTDVRDTVRGYRLIVERGRPARPYNVCAGTAYRIADLLDRLIALAGTAIRIEQDPARLRPSDTPILLGDRSRITAETGWRPEIPIERTLEDLLEYWRGVTASNKTTAS